MNIDNNHNDEIPIYDIFSLLIKKKKFISLVTIIFAIFSVFFSLSLPNIYTSSSVLSVIDDSGSKNISALASQYGGLASMAGISLPSASGEDKSSLVIQTLLSRDFVKRLIENEGILPGLIAAEGFDKNTMKVIFDDEVFNGSKNLWVRKPPKNKNKIPSYLEAHEAYIKIISVSKDKLTGYITLSVDHVSPVFAKDFLSLVINEINTSIRNRDMQEANDSIAYLKNKLITTQETDIQYSINQLIMTQLEKLMLVNVRGEYIVSPIDNAFIPENKSAPARAIICIILTMIGFMISCIFILIQHYTSNEISQ